MKRKQYDEMKQKALNLINKAHIVFTPEEKERFEVSDYMLNDVEHTGLALMVYINDDHYCAKELALLPHQTCPEHRHDPFGSYSGKQETFRCRYGTVYLYTDGEPAKSPKVQPPKGVYTVWHEIVLNPGEQYTLLPGTKHWFQAGDEGAVVSEFSTKSFDEFDIFTDPQIKRYSIIED